jgi:single-stranded-DNA-specific exonuclease
MKQIKGEKYIWKLPEQNNAATSALATTYNLSFPILQTLINRGYTNRDMIEQFLFTPREHAVADPILLKDAEKAVERIHAAIKYNEKILIAGDYDVDGITATSLMMLCLLPLGAHVNFFLPHRIYDGYGLSVKTVTRAADNGYKLIITVDNGITAFEAIEEAHKRGVEVIITDHHRPHDHVPSAYAIVNPNQFGCAYPYKNLAGVGVAFKVMSLLYAQLGKQLPEKVYELLLFGTVADVVPLTGENRFWVRHGLQHINRSETASVRVLKQNAQLLRPHLTALDIGFGLAPQINALGRLEDPRQGVKFLVGTDEQETERVGRVLYELNQARKAVERAVYAEVEQKILSGAIDLKKELIIMASGANWPAGVIGLVAGRLMCQYGRPVILLHEADGKAKGSCRSIAAFNMFEALHVNKDLLYHFGGHHSAAGLTLPLSNVPLLKDRLEMRMREMITEEDLQQKIELDAEIALPEANAKLMKDMAYLEPFGCENSRPSFYVKNVTLIGTPTLLKEEHVKCNIFAEGVIKPVIFFGRPELYGILTEIGSESFDMAVQVTENHWRGQVSIEFQGLDVAWKKL